MRAGELRHRLTIKQKSVVRDDYGQETITWTTFATVWGSVEPLSGDTYIAGQQLEAAVDTRIRIRYLSGVVPTMEVYYGSHTYDIKSVIHLKEKKVEMHLMCKEVLVL